MDLRERHKLAERERRKSMKGLFLSLHALLPHANIVRKEQSVILDEIIKYIPLAAARLRSLETRGRDSSPDAAPPPPSASTTTITNDVHAKPSPSSSSSNNNNNNNKNNLMMKKRSCVTGGGGGGVVVDCDIRVAPEPWWSVAIRVRGERVNVSVTVDTKGRRASQAILLSAVLDELEAHHLELLRSTHFRDGTKLIHHSENKISDGQDQSLLNTKLQELASKLHNMRKPSSLKRSFDQLNSVDQEE